MVINILKERIVIMKFNQFAHVKVPFEQKLAELNRIAFLHAGDEDLASNHIYRLFFLQ